jgi:hypothetical protein
MRDAFEGGTIKRENTFPEKLLVDPTPTSSNVVI